MFTGSSSLTNARTDIGQHTAQGRQVSSRKPSHRETAAYRLLDSPRERGKRTTGKNLTMPLLLEPVDLAVCSVPLSLRNLVARKLDARVAAGWFRSKRSFPGEDAPLVLLTETDPVRLRNNLKRIVERFWYASRPSGVKPDYVTAFVEELALEIESSRS